MEDHIAVHPALQVEDGDILIKVIGWDVLLHIDNTKQDCVGQLPNVPLQGLVGGIPLLDGEPYHQVNKHLDAGIDVIHVALIQVQVDLPILNQLDELVPVYHHHTG